MNIKTRLKRLFNPHADREEREIYSGPDGTFIQIINGRPVNWLSHCAQVYHEYEQWQLKTRPLAIKYYRERVKKQSSQKAIRRQRKKLYLRTGS